MGRKKKKAPSFVASEAQEFPKLSAEQGFEDAYVQIGGIRITNHGLSRPQRSPSQLRRRQGPGARLQLQQRQRQPGAPRSAALSDSGSGEDGDFGGGRRGDDLDADLADYLQNVMGGSRSSKKVAGSSGGGGSSSRKRGAAKGRLAVGDEGVGEQLQREGQLEEQLTGDADRCGAGGGDEAAEAGGGGGAEQVDQLQQHQEEVEVEEDGEDDEEEDAEEEGEEDEDEDEEEEEEVRGDTAMLRLLLQGFSCRDLDEGDGEEEDGGRGNLYEALLGPYPGGSAGETGSSSSGGGSVRDDDTTGAVGEYRRSRSRRGSMGYYYEIRTGKDGREEVVVVSEQTWQPERQLGAAGGSGGADAGADVDMTGVELGAAAGAAAGDGGDGAGEQSQPGLGQQAGDWAEQQAAPRMNRFPFVMRSRWQVREAAAAAVMATSASGGATPAAPRCGRNNQRQQQQPGGGEERQRSAAKGAKLGALRPGEKKKLRKEKILAKRSAREATRGFDVVRVAEQIADFVAGEGDVLALDPLGSLGTAVAQSLAGVYGLRHSMQGSAKKKFLLLQPTDRTKAPDDKTHAKVAKIVAAEVARQQRGAAAGVGLGPAGMALQDVTVATVAAARRGQPGSRGAARAPGGPGTSGLGQGRGKAGSYSQPVAFVRSGVQRDGDDDDEDEDDGGDGGEDGGTGGEDSSDGDEGLAGGSGEAGAPVRSPDGSGRRQATTRAEAEAEAEAEGRFEAGCVEEGEEEEADAEELQAHRGLGVMDAQREWLAEAFGGLGFRAHPHTVEPTGHSGGGRVEDPHAAAPPLVPPPEPLLGPSDQPAPAEEAEAAGDELRPVISEGGVSYFRAHFCLGPGYAAEEPQIQICTTGEILAPRRLVPQTGLDAEMEAEGREAYDMDGRCGAVHEEAAAEGLGGDDGGEGAWTADRRRGRGGRKGKGRGAAGAGGSGGGGRGRQGPVSVPPGGIPGGMGSAASASGELGKTCQQVKAAGKRAAKEARRQERLQQQPQQGHPLRQQQPQQPVVHHEGIMGEQQQGYKALTEQQQGQVVAPANLSYEYGTFERFGSGIGSRLMARMGWAQGDGLGRARQGRAEPLRAFVRPKSLGLGADG